MPGEAAPPAGSAGASAVLLPPLSQSGMPAMGVSQPPSGVQSQMPMGQIPTAPNMPPMPQQAARSAPPPGGAAPSMGLMAPAPTDRAPMMNEPNMMPAQQGQLSGGAMPMAPGAAAAQPQPYRQLKVEDALAYLDQVKMKFEKQPHIYNKVRGARVATSLPLPLHWRCRTPVTRSPRASRRYQSCAASTKSREVCGVLITSMLLRACRSVRTVPRHHEGIQGAEHRHAGRHRSRPAALPRPP